MLYVDGMLIVGYHVEKIVRLKKELFDFFDMIKDFDLAKRILRVEIVHDRLTN